MNKKMTFEESCERLENIVKKLEGGEMSLDESLSAFEEAVSLVKICNEKLECAERKVKMLVTAADGTVTDTPFETADDEN